MRKIGLILLLAALIFMAFILSATAQTEKEVKLFLNEEKTHWVKGTGLGQIWIRYTDLNPGSTVVGTAKDQVFDVGLRRVRYQVMGQVTDHVFVYTQFGINSFGSLSARKPGLFLHDVTAEYAVVKYKLSLGAGLHGWNGTVRYSSSSVASILGLDLPYIEESTNDITDQFVRKLGIYAKGKLGELDYRVSVSNPFPIQTALVPVPTLPENVTNIAYYSSSAPAVNYQGYFFWQFHEKESNQIPYMTGTYLGKKNVFNIGVGFSTQDHATEYRETVTSPVIQQASRQFGLDVFYDAPLDQEKGTALTVYAALIDYDFGPNYLRNAGAINPANGTTSQGAFNGPGNNAPLIGTGQVYYAQMGYLMRNDLLGKQSTLQPYAQLIVSDYERVEKPITIYDIGVNWLQAGHRSKLSLDYQSRPILAKGNSEKLVKNESDPRKGMLVMQYQFSF
ncbi:hypothetical protein SAMN03080617_00751 [Algoriphagus alkaliphilus]|uniref:Short chain amide porin n=1 Tax=Algoriphagus alkaliphilus TaxID=279824 RepID=A0A1G5VYF4_9BACT|nr:hypothetical protein [Algoriphagus alkaliphilus]SDA50758.1 hypothetical protein SAMN03080617_00751 [Algoriphagus alkaliphilus]